MTTSQESALGDNVMKIAPDLGAHLNLLMQTVLFFYLNKFNHRVTDQMDWILANTAGTFSSTCKALN